MSRWVTICTFNQASEVMVIKSTLEAAGIACFLKDELTVQTNNLYSQAVGGIKLQVPEEDVQEAVVLCKEAGYAFSEDEGEYKIQLALQKMKSVTENIPLLGLFNFGTRMIMLLLLLATLIYGVLLMSKIIL